VLRRKKRLASEGKQLKTCVHVRAITLTYELGARQPSSLSEGKQSQRADFRG
jgi:hypothetical protein